MSVQRSATQSLIVSFLAVYTLLGLVAGHLRLFSASGSLLVSGFLWKIAACGVLAAILVQLGLGVIRRRHLGQESIPVAPEIFLLGFVAVLVSDFTSRRWVFSAGEGYLTTVLLLGVGGGRVTSIDLSVQARYTCGKRDSYYGAPPSTVRYRFWFYYARRRTSSF